MYDAEKCSIWIVSDCRRKTDVQFFEELFGREQVRRIRIEVSEDTRKKRGFVFQNGVDDAESECGLDNLDGGFDYVVHNDGIESEKQVLSSVIEWIKAM